MNWTKITGAKNKFFAQSNDGKLKVDAKTSSEIVIYSKDNPKPPKIASDYEMRDTATRAFVFSHLWTPDTATVEGYEPKEYRNIFDQSFTIISTLDVGLVVQLSPMERSGGVSEVGTPFLYTLDLGTIDAKTGASEQGMVIVPERSDPSIPILPNRIVVAVPELRQPFPGFYLSLKPNGTPTTGEVRILNCRRF